VTGNLVIVARIVAPFGRFGEVKALLETDFPEALAARKDLFVARSASEGERRAVESVRFHKGAALVKFEGVDSIDDAEELRGLLLAVPEEDRPELAEGQFWMGDIIGLEAVYEDGRPIGRITEVLRGKANDVWVAGDVMIPAIRDVVAEVDVPGGRVVVRAVEGLE